MLILSLIKSVWQDGAASLAHNSWTSGLRLFFLVTRPPAHPLKFSKCQHPKIESNSVSLSFLNFLKIWNPDSFFCDEGHAVAKKLFLRQVSAHESVCKGRGGKERRRAVPQMRTDTVIGDNGWGRESDSRLGTKQPLLPVCIWPFHTLQKLELENCRSY